MLIYTHSNTRATRPASNAHSPRHRASFAREAAINAFGHRAASALDDPGFKDRQPDQPPRLLGQVATKITHDTGQKSLRHWLNKAGRADTDEEREAALRTVHEIGRLMGLDADQIGREAA